MAVSKGFGQFRARIDTINRQIQKRAESIVKKAAARALQVAVFATRVDTGRARGGWVITLGNEVPGEETPLDPGGASTVSRGQQEIERFNIDRGTTIALSNNVEYILFLDQGTPRTPADNMVAQATAAAISYLRGAKLI